MRKINKLKLIHNKEKFLLEINDRPLKFIKGYTIEANAEKGIDVIIKMSIDKGSSSIDINNDKVNLRQI